MESVWTVSWCITNHEWVMMAVIANNLTCVGYGNTCNCMHIPPNSYLRHPLMSSLQSTKEYVFQKETIKRRVYSFQIVQNGRHWWTYWESGTSIALPVGAPKCSDSYFPNCLAKSIDLCLCLFFIPAKKWKFNFLDFDMLDHVIHTLLTPKQMLTMIKGYNMEKYLIKR